MWYLKNCHLFERLAAEALSKVEIASRVRTFPKKSPIYLPADHAQDVFLLATGRIKLCHVTPDGKQSILAFIDPGELFGELAMLDGGQREEYAEALEKSTVVLIPRVAIEQLMEAHAHLTMGVTKMIGLRRRRIERRLKNLLFLSNRDRLIHLILDLVEQYGKTTEDGVALAIKLSHQELANVIGSTRETVTVLLGEMQLEGLLKVGRRRMVIAKLENMAASVHRPVPEMPREAEPRPLRPMAPGRSISAEDAT